MCSEALQENDGMSYDPPTVRRVFTQGGSHIEPPFDENWDNLTKLRWQAAVMCGFTNPCARTLPASSS